MMDTFNRQLAANPLNSRQDAAALLLDLIRPLRAHYSADGATLHIGSTAAHYGERSARVEGWARVLWGLGPLFGGGSRSLPAAMQVEINGWAELYQQGLIHGTDPGHPGYWGDIYDFDQKMVEIAALDVALVLAPDVLWEPLTDGQRQNVYRWLDQMNDHRIHPNNWRFFRILTNMVFARLGLPVNTERLKDDFGIVERCYTGGGWYFDGNDGQLDYYIPFAMHFYALIWAALSPLDENGYREKLKGRSAQFAGDFIHWFSDDGAELPFGRSLTYRFAHSAFFSALALAGVESPAMPWGAAAAYAFDAGNTCRAEMVRTFPNTNLMAPLCAVPTLVATLQPGTHLLLHAFFGDVSGTAGTNLDAIPKVVPGPVVSVLKSNGQTVLVDLEARHD